MVLEGVATTTSALRKILPFAKVARISRDLLLPTYAEAALGMPLNSMN